MSLDSKAVRREFALLERELGGLPLTYLDSASTAPRPRAVLAAIGRYHAEFTGNVHRGVHALASEASEAFEAARHVVAAHLGATPGEVVFTAGVTDAANLIADALALGPEHEVVTTQVEHHSNLLPWRKRANVLTLPTRDDGCPDFDALESLCTPRTRLIAVHHVSNVLGTLAPIERITAFARARGILTFVDGAQSAGHVPLDMRRLGCDLFAFSGHKVGGPAGSGALFVREALLDELAPARVGGGMVARVRGGACEWRTGAARFEAGTPNVEGVLGLAAALTWLARLGREDIAAHSALLARQLYEQCASLPGVRVLGSAQLDQRTPLVSLVLPAGGLDAQSVARTLSDAFGVLVSAGQHCTHPLHERLELDATLRASAWVHNDSDDVERFVGALRGLIA